MANASKRKISYSISSGSMSSRPKTIPDLLNEVTSSQKKRRRISLAKTENESSTDSVSLSNFIPSDSEGSSDSEFEEHPYSRAVPLSSKRFERSRPRPKSNSNVRISELETDLRGIKRSKCTSKNAMMARLNRLKKKKYIEDLENKNAELEAENQMLKRMLDIRVKEMESLKKKALNLENVIRNSTEIGSLLKCVRQHTDLQISSSLLRSESTSSHANEEAPAEKPATSRDFHEFEVSSNEEEALVAAVLWWLALHTFCQPYKLRTSDTLSLQVQR